MPVSVFTYYSLTANDWRTKSYWGFFVRHIMLFPIDVCPASMRHCCHCFATITKEQATYSIIGETRACPTIVMLLIRTIAALPNHVQNNIKRCPFRAYDSILANKLKWAARQIHAIIANGSDGPTNVFRLLPIRLLRARTHATRASLIRPFQ